MCGKGTPRRWEIIRHAPVFSWPEGLKGEIYIQIPHSGGVVMGSPVFWPEAFSSYQKDKADSAASVDLS